MEGAENETRPKSPLVLQDLRAWYGDGEKRTEILAEVSLSVEPGEVLGIFGPNGCGKTTLLRTIAGVHPKMAGTVTLPRVDHRRARAALIPQSYRESFFEWASLRLNLVMTCADAPFAQYRQNAARIARIAGELGLALDLGLRPGRCSNGMLQQAAALRALVNDPDLLFADEPFAALDVEVARKLRTALRRAVTNRGIVAVLVLHDLESIVEICDKVLVVAGKPYSTRDKPGHHRAHLLENKWRPERPVLAEAPAADTSFVEVMKRVLEPRGDGE